MEIKNFYINETDSLLESIIEVYPDIIKSEYFQSIKNNIKKNNNNIGYMSFDNQDIHINIIIFPKIIKIENNQCNEDQKKKYIDILKNFFSLAEKYKKITWLNNKYTFANFIKDQNNNLNSFFESILEYQYFYVLEQLEKFFKVHNPIFEEKNKFYDKCIKSKLDIKKNIIEINKSKIHQINIQHYSNSELAIIIFSKLEYLLKFDSNRFSKNIKNKILMLRNKIKGKYFIESAKYIHKNIFDYSIKRYFKNKEDILKYILVLLGKENLLTSENLNNNYYESSSIDFKTFFIDPKLIFEFYVYDKYKNNTQYSEIKLQRIHVDIKENYSILKTTTAKSEIIIKSSEPDMRLEENNTYQLVDIKWKILKNGTLPDIADLLKLKRDYSISEINNRQKNVLKDLILIYPKSDNNEDYKVILDFDSDINYYIKFMSI